ncbi:MAG TPA: YggT family protein [Candidatus Polarisedimenticolia bacterium]|jgi:uncharacterized protein YggT (Ycf19 family)
MPEDRTLSKDEARRLAQHEKVNAHVVDEVQVEILNDANQIAPAERRHVERVAHDLKRKAINEVGETDLEIRRGRAVARLRQVVDYVFYLVYGLIGLQILLELIGAREGSGFKQLMNSLTSPLLGPFRGLVVDPGVGSFQFMLSYVIGLLVYALLQFAIRGLLRVIASRRTEL